MSEVEIKYGLDDTPPFFENLLFGLQWLAITVATVIIIGNLMVSIVVSYLPSTVKAAFSPLLMPIVGNGVVMGWLC